MAYHLNQLSNSVGYKFCPTDEELLTHYLKNMLLEKPLPPHNIIKLDIYGYSPEDLSGFFRKEGEKSMFFLAYNDELRPAKQGPIRFAGIARNGLTFTSNGFWKSITTGDGIIIGSKENPIGYKKTFVYYQGISELSHRGNPELKAKETSWILDEYRLQQDIRVNDLVLHKIYSKDEIHDNATSTNDDYLLKRNQDKNCKCNYNCSTVVSLLYNKFMCLIIDKKD